MIPLVKKGVFKKLAKSVGLGIVDSFPVLGTIKQNIESNTPDKGTLDVIRLVTTLTASGALAWAFYLYGKESLSFDQLEQLIKALF